MRGTTNGVGLLVAVLFGLCGCVTTGNQIKPPKLPEQYNSPPADDARYTNPPKYPKETLARPLLKKDNGMGAGPGAAGMGMPGGGASAGAPMSVGGSPGFAGR